MSIPSTLAQRSTSAGIHLQTPHPKSTPVMPFLHTVSRCLQLESMYLRIVPFLSSSIVDCISPSQSEKQTVFAV